MQTVATCILQREHRGGFVDSWPLASFAKRMRLCYCYYCCCCCCLCCRQALWRWWRRRAAGRTTSASRPDGAPVGRPFARLAARANSRDSRAETRLRALREQQFGSRKLALHFAFNPMRFGSQCVVVLLACNGVGNHFLPLDSIESPLTTALPRQAACCCCCCCCCSGGFSSQGSCVQERERASV